jgi:hypothetical protein
MNEPTSEIVKLRERFHAAAGEADRPADCPAAGRIWDALHGGLSPEERRTIVDHTARCPACAEAWRLARDIGGTAPVAEQAEAGHAGVGPVHGVGWRRWVPLAAAAALVVVVGLLLRQGPIRDDQPPQYRTGEELAIHSLLPDGAPLPRSACLLRWSAGPEGARYDIEVATADLEVIVRARGLERAEFTVPADRLADLPPGAELLWRVEAMLPDGRRITTPTFICRVE